MIFLISKREIIHLVFLVFKMFHEMWFTLNSEPPSKSKVENWRECDYFGQRWKKLMTIAVLCRKLKRSRKVSHLKMTLDSRGCDLDDVLILLVVPDSMVIIIVIRSSFSRKRQQRIEGETRVKENRDSVQQKRLSCASLQSSCGIQVNGTEDDVCFESTQDLNRTVRVETLVTRTLFSQRISPKGSLALGMMLFSLRSLLIHWFRCLDCKDKQTWNRDIQDLSFSKFSCQCGSWL
jgi:hypothetical protein